MGARQIDARKLIGKASNQSNRKLNFKYILAVGGGGRKICMQELEGIYYYSVSSRKKKVSGSLRTKTTADQHELVYHCTALTP